MILGDYTIHSYPKLIGDDQNRWEIPSPAMINTVMLWNTTPVPLRFLGWSRAPFQFDGWAPFQFDG